MAEVAKIERRDFLVEVGTEELPPKALRELELAFASGVTSGLAAVGLAHGQMQSFATPRRIAVLVKRLVSRQPQQNIKRRGPPVTAAFDARGQPTRAATAFAESCGVPVSELQKLEEGKGQFLFYIGTKPGTDAVVLLPGIVQAALDALPIPKRMRWGSGDAEFVRPVHWLVMMYGKDVVPASVLGVPAGNTTRGHRFMAPKEIRLTSPAGYAKALRDRGKVIADFVERRTVIRDGVAAKAEEVGGRAVMDDALLDEVAALVEWPVPLAARFEERFLDLPREVLIATLQEHQRYFPVENASGALMAWFIAVSNIESLDPAQVRAGNERVVRPRLADAAFFWEQDRKLPLAARREALDKVTFQAKLGSLGDKVKRIRALASEIAASLHEGEAPNGGDPRALAERAAELCKCDLLTALVGEFPELQGVMGGYYAQADGEAPEVAIAIREHYLPRGAGDALPSTNIGVAVSVADKLDTLAGIFAIGQKPTGAKDPFGLRRAAIGVLRMLIEKQLDLDLRGLIERAVALQPVQAEHVADEIYEYVMERLRSYYLDGTALQTPGQRTITTEMFDAVLATRPRSPLDFDARLRALSAFLEMPEATSLTAANKRIANILRKSDDVASTEVDIAVLREDAEIRLFDAVRGLRESVSAATARREYTAALGQLAQLRPAVDGFFDQVMVNAEDPKLRANRLALLAGLRGLFGGVADLSRLPG
ncbi:MAG TPA: glycine--tRNA ligase subunit beta [Steroidobacteraceae bacterium]|nr:glycine--tRNA ligase subunit beta [Steroidobacteraceae bacterium]